MELGEWLVNLEHPEKNTAHWYQLCYVIEITYFLSLRTIIYVPDIYSNNIGNTMNHMVMPLPSGVTNALKIIMIRTAYLNLSFQNWASTNPSDDIVYITIGS